tara:strand:+ start:2322 stop:2507 length:186 start_codon:yes stop_codon:yes gene_type:complete
MDENNGDEKMKFNAKIKEEFDSEELELDLSDVGTVFIAYADGTMAILVRSEGKIKVEWVKE